MLTALKHTATAESAEKARNRIGYVAAALSSIGAIIGLLSIWLLR
jgi:hypothetical protein